MASWAELSRENRSAARELLERGRFRSCVSRCYYALYAELTGRLTDQGFRMHPQRQNPNHADLPRFVERNLAVVDEPCRRGVKRCVHRLLAYRVLADYVPGLTVDAALARRAMGELSQAMRLLERHA